MGCTQGKAKPMSTGSQQHSSHQQQQHRQRRSSPGKPAGGAGKGGAVSSPKAACPSPAGMSGSPASGPVESPSRQPLRKRGVSQRRCSTTQPLLTYPPMRAKSASHDGEDMDRLSCIYNTADSSCDVSVGYMSVDTAAHSEDEFIFVRQDAYDCPDLENTQTFGYAASAPAGWTDSEASSAC